MTTSYLEAPARTQFKVKLPIWQQPGFGFTVEYPIYNAVEALVLAGANWGVYDRTLEASLEDVVTGEDYRFDGTGVRGVFRDFDNQYLGAVGMGFRLVQNHTGFNWFMPFLESGNAYIESAGTLRKGEIVWIVARLSQQNSQEVLPGDTVEQRLLLTLCHNTRRAPQATFINTRTSCQNVLGQASHIGRNGKSLMKMRQTKNIEHQMARVGDKVQIARDCFAQDVQAYQNLAAKSLSLSTMRQILSELYVAPLSRQIERDGTLEEKYTLDTYKPTRAILSALDTLEDLQLTGVIGTGWALYNAIAHYYTYLETASRRGSPQTKIEAQLESLWFVEKTSMLNHALDTILTY